MKKQVKSDSLRIPYHPNVVPILRFSRNETINTKTLPDHEEFWSKNGLKGILPDSGMILTLYYPLVLDKFLKQRVDENFMLSPLEVILLLRGILKGVYWLHTKGIVHRDLHPENIFVDPEKGRVWIADFGCSLDLRENFKGFKIHKKHPALFGFSYSTTPSLFKGGEGGCAAGGFLAPEISNFDSENEDYLNYDKCDLYAVGVLGKYLLHHSEALPDGEIKKHVEMLLEGLTKENMDERIGWKKSLKSVDFAYDCCRVLMEKRNTKNSPLPPKVPNQKRKWNSGKSKIYHVYPSHCLLEKRIGVDIFFSVEREKYLKRLLHSCQLITSCRFGEKNAEIHKGCRAEIPDSHFFYRSKIGEEDKKKCEGCELVLYVKAPEYDHMCYVDVGFSILSRSSENGVEWVGKERCFQYYEDDSNISSVGNKIKDLSPNPTEQELNDSGSIFGSDGQDLFGGGEDSNNYNENQTDIFNANVLFYAVAQDKVDLVKFLVEKRGFNVNTSDILGYSIRDIAEYFNRNELFSYLLDKGTESQKTGIDSQLFEKLTLEPGLNIESYCEKCDIRRTFTFGLGHFDLADVISQCKCMGCDSFPKIEKIKFKKCTYSYDMVSSELERVRSDPIVTIGEGKFETERRFVKLQFIVELLPDHLNISTGTGDPNNQEKEKPQSRKVDLDEVSQKVLTKFEIPDSEIQIVKMIGGGSHGKVYSAIWNGSGGGDEIAVKEIPIMKGVEGNTREELIREFQIMMDMSYRRVVRVFGYTLPEGKTSFRILMELMDGDIGRLVRKEKDLTLYDKFELMHKMTEGLNYLHSKRCVHRNVKSFNFLHRDNGREVVINDFDLAFFLKNTQTSATGKLKGTVRWMAPELIVENPSFSFASDIYAMGITYWEVLFEDIPFRSINNDFVVLSLIRDKYLKPDMSDPSLPKQLKELVISCLNKEQKERPTSEELLEWFKHHRELFKNKYNVVMKFKCD